MLEIMFGARVRDKDRMLHAIEVQDRLRKALKKLESGETGAREKNVCGR